MILFATAITTFLKRLKFMAVEEIQCRWVLTYFAKLNLFALRNFHLDSGGDRMRSICISIVTTVVRC